MRPWLVRNLPVAYAVTSGCVDVMDKTCLEACPVDCIHFEEGRDRMAFIDPRQCIGCAACVEACPVAAIVRVDEAPAEERAFIDINRAYFKRRSAARRAVDDRAGAQPVERTGT